MNTLSSLLNFIGGKIADAQSPETFTLTLAEGIAGGTGYGVYDKVSGIVRLNFNFSNPDTNIPIGTPIFTVPQKYVPSTNKAGSGFIQTMTGDTLGAAGARFLVYTNGELRTPSSGVVRRGFGYIEYVLGGVIRSISNAFSTLTLGKGVA